MPIYEYRCASCGREFEELIRSAADERSVHCPQCRGRSLQRKLSVFAAQADTARAPRSAASPGACGRCGDPNGPCGF
ncbi:MAG: zinc ribbon domain-containing protein [Planctomycetes bacterium]|nr:zinc ribbon domain-containing protein [Planctomycetota bacterium]